MSCSAQRIANLAQALVPVVATHTKVTVADTVITASTSGVTAVGDYYLVQVETATVRMILNGTDPDATTGYRYTAGAELLLSKAEWLAARWVRETATSATLQVGQLS
jgi:hypothetical protein